MDKQQELKITSDGILARLENLDTELELLDASVKDLIELQKQWIPTPQGAIL